MCKLNRTTILFILMAVLATSAFAGKRYAVANGYWDQTSTWSITSGGTSGAAVPTSSDTVYIAEASNGRSVTIPAGYTAVCNRLEIGLSSNSNSGYLTFSSGATLNISQDILIWGGTSSYTRQITVGTGTLNITGNLTLNKDVNGVQSNRNSIIQITTGTVNLSGELYFFNISGSDNSQCQINISGAGNFSLGGAFTIDYNTGTISPGSTSNFTFNGSNDQSIPIGVSNIKYNNLLCSNIGTKTISAAITTSNVTGDVRINGGTLSNNGYTIVGNGTKSFEVANGARYLMLGTTSMVTGFQTKTFGTTSTVEYGGSNQTVSGESYGHLTLSGSGTKTMPTASMILAGNFSMSGTCSATAGDAITVNGNFSLGTGTSFNANSFIHNIKGNFSNSGTFTAANSTIIFNGTSSQNISGDNASTFNNFTINNANGINLNKTASVNGVLTLTSGNITTGSETLRINSTGSVSRTSGHIVGNLKKYIETGATVVRIFEIGSGSNYLPVIDTFTNVSSAGYLTVKTVNGDYPGISGSGVDSALNVNRYWTMTADSALVFDDYKATFNFLNPGDLDSGADTGIFIVGKKDGAWTYPDIGIRTSTSTQAIGMTSFSDYVVGEPKGNTITFRHTGLSSDYTGFILNVDGTNYYYTDLPKSFVWKNNSSHNFQYYDTLAITGKRYIWTATTGLASTKSGTILVSDTGSVIASYKIQYELTMAANYGTTTPSVGSHWYDAGTIVGISATSPSAGAGEQYVWNGWTGIGSISYTGSNNPVSITMNSAIAQTASWTHQYQLTMATNYGTTTPAVGNHWYNAGAVVNISASSPTAGAGVQYIWEGWSGSGSISYTGMNNTATVTMNSAITQTASWKVQYRLTMAASYGTTTPAIGEHWYDVGTVVNISTSAPIPGSGEQYIWNGWVGSGTISYTGAMTDTFVTMNSPISQTASWTRQFYLTVTSPHGTPGGSGWYNSGVNAYATVTPLTVAGSTGIQYVFSNWSVDASGSSSPSNPIYMDGPKTATAVWKTQYYLTVTSPYGTPGGFGWYDAGINAYASVTPLTVAGGSGIQYVFTNWTGDATGSNSPSDPIYMDNPKTAIAVWKTQYYLTVNSAHGTPGGMGWYDTNATAYATISPLTVPGASGVQYIFTNWSGDATGSTSPSDPITMNGPKTATASWKTQYELTMTANYGTTTPAIGSYWYDAGTVVFIQTSSPTPGAGEQFIWNGWTGTGTISYTGSNNSAQVTMNSPITQTASWIQQFYLTVTSPYGTTGGSGWYNSGTNAYATVTPLSVPGTTGIQYVFTNWSVDATGTTSPSDPITMSGPKTATAVWKTQYYLNVTSPYGTPGGFGWYDAGINAYASVTPLTVAGGSGIQYVFTNWTGDATGSNSPSDPIYMDNPKTATAVWKTQYQLTISTNWGTTTPSAGSHWYDAGAIVDISTSTPIPGAGEQYIWNGWTGTGVNSYSGMANPAQITMTNPITEVASWTHQYQLTIATNDGTTSPPVGTHWYNAGSTVNIQAYSGTPGPGQYYVFNGWTGSGAGSYTGINNPASITMNGAITETAQWTLLLIPRTLTITIDPIAGGSVQLNPPGGVYEHGTIVMMEARSSIGYDFVTWSGSISTDENPVYILMDGDKSVTANFAVSQYTLTVNVIPEGSGTIEFNPPGDPTYAYGTTVTVTAHQNEEFNFSHWSGDISSTQNPIDIIIDNNKTVNANFVFNGTWGWALKETIPQASDIIKPNKRVKDGGALVGAGNDLYAFHGNKSWKFYKYSVTGWDTTLTNIPFSLKYKPNTPLDSTKWNMKKKIGKGAALCFDGDHTIYATKGNGTYEFFAYDINTNTWSAKAFLPSTKPAKGGTSLTYKDGYVYLLVGGVKAGLNNFFAYDVNSDAWTTLDNAPITPNNKAWKDGSQIVALGDYIYCLKGKDKYNPLWTYHIATGTWTEKTQMPILNVLLKKTKVADGGSMTTDGSALYAIKGGGKPEFWYYVPGDSGEWASLPDIPRNDPGNKKSVPKTGASLAYAAGRIWLIKGNNSWEFWRYIAPTIPPTSVRPQTNKSLSIEKTDKSALSNFVIIPNPIKNIATIRYSVVTAGNVKIKLYNSSGCCMRTLLDNEKNIGNYAMNFSAAGLSKGIYFLKLKNNTSESELKLIIQ